MVAVNDVIYEQENEDQSLSYKQGNHIRNQTEFVPIRSINLNDENFDDYVDN